MAMNDWANHQMVVNIGDEGTWDTTHNYHPMVILDGSTYKMWRSGAVGSQNRIVYATSVNGTTWINHALAINVNVEGTYDTDDAHAPTVLKEGPTDYKMWYTGYDGTNWRILYADSTNGTSWANHQLVININVEGTYDTSHAYAPKVIKDGSTYKMWYSGHNGTTWRIMYATSSNGTTWANHAMVLNIGDEGTYDTVSAYTPMVVKDGATYHMWYAGLDASRHRIIYADSANGTTWANHALVQDYNVEATYDTVHVEAPTVLFEGLNYKIWYSGYNGVNSRILFADSSDPAGPANVAKIGGIVIANVSKIQSVDLATIAKINSVA